MWADCFEPIMRVCLRRRGGNDANEMNNQEFKTLKATWMKHAALILLLASASLCSGQTDCMDSGSPLETAPPKAMTSEQLIQKFTANESKVRDARSQYTLTRDAMVQTLQGTTSTGQWHEVADLSYDTKGKPVEKVTYSEVSTCVTFKFRRKTGMTFAPSCPGSSPVISRQTTN